MKYLISLLALFLLSSSSSALQLSARPQCGEYPAFVDVMLKQGFVLSAERPTPEQDYVQEDWTNDQNGEFKSVMTWLEPHNPEAIKRVCFLYQGTIGEKA